MWIPVVITMLCTIQTFTKPCQCLHLIDLPQNFEKVSDDETYEVESDDNESDVTDPPPIKNNVNNVRRYWLVNEKPNFKGKPIRKTNGYEDEKDQNLKTKISTLVQQTLHDTERKIKSIQYIKDMHREQAPYRAGFILSMVKKSKDVLNELFNVAVKHRDDWKALEQMKLFEVIVHTNVDTTNLVRQLVEIHIQHLNTTAGDDGKVMQRKRVVLL